MAIDPLSIFSQKVDSGSQINDITKARPDLVKRGWTQEMWDARRAESGLHKAFSSDEDFEKDWVKGKTAHQSTKAYMDAQQAKAKEDPNAAKQAAFDAQLDEFYKQMTSPLDPNDPEVKAASQIASNVATRAAKLRGIKGGVVASEVGRNVANANTAITSQRKQLGLSALGMKGQNLAGLQNLALKQKALDADIAQNEYDNDVGNAQASGAGLGGVVGGVAGAVGTYFTGDPKLIGEGIKAGSSIGAGIGGSSVKKKKTSYSGGGY